MNVSADHSTNTGQRSNTSNKEFTRCRQTHILPCQCLLLNINYYATFPRGPRQVLLGCSGAEMELGEQWRPKPLISLWSRVLGLLCLGVKFVITSEEACWTGSFTAVICALLTALDKMSFIWLWRGRPSRANLECRLSYHKHTRVSHMPGILGLL